MTYVLRYHPRVVEEDIPKIAANVRGRIARALETRLTSEPTRYGAPLRGPLGGYWKLRVGDYRAVFRIVGGEVRILALLHRSRVYEVAARRSARGGRA